LPCFYRIPITTRNHLFPERKTPKARKPKKPKKETRHGVYPAPLGSLKGFPDEKEKVIPKPLLFFLQKPPPKILRYSPEIFSKLFLPTLFPGMNNPCRIPKHLCGAGANIDACLLLLYPKFSLLPESVSLKITSRRNPTTSVVGGMRFFQGIGITVSL
jgi:hypothetical protein